MTLLTAFLLILAAQSIVRVNRVNIQHWLASSRIGRWHFDHDMMTEANAAGVDWELADISMAARHISARIMFDTTYRVVLLIAGSYLLTWAWPGLVWQWTWLAGLMIAFLPMLDRIAMRNSGNGAAKVPMTRAEALTAIIGDLLAAGILTATLAFGCTAPQQIRAWAAAAGPSASSMLAGIPSWLWTCLCAVVFIAGLWTAYGVTRFAGRLSRMFSSPRFELRADEDTMLYLRSFQDDRQSIQTPVAEFDSNTNLRSLLWPRISFEEMIANCSAANTRGLITVGRPGERLPRAGAVRGYYAQDDWREGVRLTAFRVRGIIFTLGATVSLHWEIEHLKQWGLLRKCLFLIPPIDDGIEQRLWPAFDALGVNKDEYRKAATIPVPTMVGFRVNDDGSVHWLLGFGHDWTTYLYAIACFNAQLDWLQGLAGDQASGRIAADPNPVQTVSRDEIEQAFHEGAAMRPGRPGATVRKTIKSARRALALEQIGEWDDAVAEYTRLIHAFDTAHGNEPAPGNTIYRDPDDAQSMAYLLYRRLASECHASPQSQQDLLILADRVIRQLDAAPTFAWPTPFESRRTAALEADVHGWVAVYAETRLGNRAMQITARTRQVEAARRAHDRRLVVDAEFNLYDALDDERRKTAVAQSILESALSMGDVRLEGKARWALGSALAGAGAERPQWEPQFRRAAVCLERCGEHADAQRVMLDLERILNAGR
ncbi:hypothetical protein [Bifidobacterium leontopitheci]|uniref:Uncharacterized protein n=1 Tax=Bifidobacterium leontopitheci TaxID=2650774 RepID=A0A6I1GV03_9BIFI|nr:hypothetical protein [Bifidobacterium leontopitheci]KAB7790281.1 hypothetical protein F7D09_1177 [Bifidobacterium leontopitheci]